MKRGINYLILIISIFALGIFTVNAESKLSIQDVSVNDKSSTITVDDLVLENNTIKSKVRFNQQDDFVDYKIIIKNDDTTSYKLTGAKTNNDNVVAEYSQTTINGKSETPIIIKLKYKTIVDSEVVLDDFELELSFSKDEENIIVNPKTSGDTALLYLIIALMIIPIIVLLINHKKASALIIVFALMLTPIIANSKEEVSLKILFEDVELAAVEETGTYTINFYPDEVTIGQAIPDGITVYEKPSEAMAAWALTEAGSSRPFYLKHVMDNNIVAESYIEFVISKDMENTYPGMKAGKYKIRGDEVGAYYEDNKAVLLEAFGEQNCEVQADPKFASCTIENRKIYGSTAGEYGMVHFINDGYDCFVYNDNTSSCGKYNY